MPNGCYTAAKDGTESDMRFLFCAAAICYVLDDWNGMDIKNATEFIINSIVRIVYKYFVYNNDYIYCSHTTME